MFNIQACEVAERIRSRIDQIIALREELLGHRQLVKDIRLDLMVAEADLDRLQKQLVDLCSGIE
jgi:hypothetical protein